MAPDNVQGLETLEARNRSKGFAVKVCRKALPLLPAEENGVWSDLRKQIEDLIRIINGYIAHLKRAKIGVNEPGANHAVRDETASFLIDYPEDDDASENQ